MNVVFKVLWAHKVSTPRALMELMVIPVQLGLRLLVGGELRELPGLRGRMDHEVQRGQLEKKEREDRKAQQDPQDHEGQQQQRSPAHPVSPPRT